MSSEAHSPNRWPACAEKGAQVQEPLVGSAVRPESTRSRFRYAPIAPTGTCSLDFFGPSNDRAWNGVHAALATLDLPHKLAPCPRTPLKHLLCLPRRLPRQTGGK